MKPFYWRHAPGARRDIYLLMTQPGADRISQPHPPGSVEHIIVTQGRALVGLLDAAEELGAGDYICYPADQPHIFKARSQTLTRCWWRNKTNRDTETHVA